MDPNGIDDTGGLKISFRVTSDMGELQFIDPLGEGYKTAEVSKRTGDSLLFDRINIAVVRQIRSAELATKPLFDDLPIPDPLLV